MPASSAPTLHLRSKPRATTRDVAVDVARALCLLWVVAFHSLMVGAWAPGGVAHVSNAMEAWGGFAALTWAGQIMPLFFLLAGFSATVQQRKALAGNGVPLAGSGSGVAVRPGIQLATRMLRLVPAVAAAACATTVGLALLASSGLDPQLLVEAGFRSAQPLWFLSVFAFCTALAPTAVRFHLRAPRLTLSALVAAAVLVDLARAVTGVDAVGLANMVFVWLALQQAGFLLADGSLDRVGRRPLLLTAAAALSALLLFVWLGVYPANLIDAMTPPTTALLILGVAHLCLFQAVRPWLNAVSLPAWVRASSSAINAHAMTIYSWHMPTVVALAGFSILALGPTLPQPLSGAWWASRGLWLAAVAVTVWLVVRWAGRWESHRPAQGEPRRRAGKNVSTARTYAALGTACAVAGPLLILVLGGTGPAWVLGTALLAACTWLCHRAS